MSRMRTITIVCWIIAALAMVGLAGFFIAGPVFGPGSWTVNIGMGGINIESLSGPFEEQGTHTVSADGIDSLDIDWIAGNVVIIPYDGSDIRITEFAQRALREGEELSLRTDGRTVRIEYNTGRSMRNLPAKNLEVLVPHALIESFAEVTVGTVSAHVDVSGVSATTLRVGTVSGRIELSGGRSHEVQLGSVSGRVTVDNVRAERFDAATTSGAMNLVGTFGDVTLGGVSGRIEFVSETVPGSLTAGTVSGAISITVPDEGPISVEHSSVSGRFASEIPVIIQGGNAQFTLSTVSGRMNIYALG